MTQSPFKRLVTEAELDAKVAAGLVGPVGPAGPTTTLSIGTVTKLAAGSTPTVQITGIAPTQSINFGVVTGDTGAKGDKGDPGDQASVTNATWGTQTINLTAATPVTKRATLTGVTTFTLTPNPGASTSFTQTLILKQDATGGRTVAWPSSVLWSYGSKPVLSTAPNAIDVVHLFWTGTEWLGFTAGQGFA